MADYIVLTKNPNRSGVGAWSVINRVDAADGEEAIRLSYQGEGKYAALPTAGAVTAEVAANPQATADTSPEF